MSGLTLSELECEKDRRIPETDRYQQSVLCEGRSCVDTAGCLIRPHSVAGGALERHSSIDRLKPWWKKMVESPDPSVS